MAQHKVLSYGVISVTDIYLSNDLKNIHIELKYCSLDSRVQRNTFELFQPLLEMQQQF